jgi:hypothetical protein
VNQGAIVVLSTLSLTEGRREMLFADLLDTVGDFLSNPLFWIPMIVVLLGLIGLFFYLRKRGSSED